MALTAFRKNYCATKKAPKAFFVENFTCHKIPQKYFFLVILAEKLIFEVTFRETIETQFAHFCSRLTNSEISPVRSHQLLAKAININ